MTSIDQKWLAFQKSTSCQASLFKSSVTY